MKCIVAGSTLGRLFFEILPAKVQYLRTTWFIFKNINFIVIHANLSTSYMSWFKFSVSRAPREGRSVTSDGSTLVKLNGLNAFL